MTTAAEIVAAAESELGYTEWPAGTNKTKFAAEAGHPTGAPWCATFVVAMARRVGLKLPNESAYTPTLFGGFANAGLGFRTRDGRLLRPGDIVFFDFPGDGVDRIQHVGICESSSRSMVTCIEGNTSPGTSGSQSNGGGVSRRTRHMSQVAAIGRPHYQEAPVPDSPPPVYPARGKVVAFQAVYRGADASVVGYYLVTDEGEVFAFGVPYFGGLDTPAA